MRLSTHKWLYIKSIILLTLTLGPVSQTIAYDSKYGRTMLGVKGAIGGVDLPAIKQYAKKYGYKQVTTPFCHLDFEGTLCIERRIFNHMSSRIELGYSYMHPSFTGATEQNKIKQSIGLHCHGGHISFLCYLYPGGRFADKGSWNGHIGFSFLAKKASKSIAAHIATKEDNKFSIASVGPVLGIGFKFISGLQLECRYSWLFQMMEKPRITDLQGVALSIGYIFK